MTDDELFLALEAAVKANVDTDKIIESKFSRVKTMKSNMSTMTVPFDDTYNKTTINVTPE